MASRSGPIPRFWPTSPLPKVARRTTLRRFREREKTPFKKFKMSPEDWRNRSRWKDYDAAVCDMVERTSTADAPWVLVPANDKRWARIHVLKTLCERIEASL